MNRELKKAKELKAGNCQVVVKGGKTFDGIYDKQLNVVFMTIPRGYEIIGYYQ